MYTVYGVGGYCVIYAAISIELAFYLQSALFSGTRTDQGSLEKKNDNDERGGGGGGGTECGDVKDFYLVQVDVFSSSLSSHLHKYICNWYSVCMCSLMTSWRVTASQGEIAPNYTKHKHFPGWIDQL